MDIIERINKVRADFEARTGAKPLVLYLGEHEALEIEDTKIFQNDDIYAPVNWRGPVRPTILGIPAYLVNAESHLRVT